MGAFRKLLTICLMAYSAAASPIAETSPMLQLEGRVPSSSALVGQRGVDYATVVIAVTQLPQDFWGSLTTQAERATYIGTYYVSQFWAHVAQDAEAASWWQDAVQGLGGRSLTQFVHFVSDTEFAWQAKIMVGGSATYDTMEDLIIDPLIYWLQDNGVHTTARMLPGRRDDVTETAEELEAERLVARAPPQCSAHGPQDLFRYLGGTAVIRAGKGSPWCTN